MKKHSVALSLLALLVSFGCVSEEETPADAATADPDRYATDACGVQPTCNEAGAEVDAAVDAEVVALATRCADLGELDGDDDVERFMTANVGRACEEFIDGSGWGDSCGYSDELLVCDESSGLSLVECSCDEGEVTCYDHRETAAAQEEVMGCGE